MTSYEREHREVCPNLFVPAHMLRLKGLRQQVSGDHEIPVAFLSLMLGLMYRVILPYTSLPLPSVLAG